MRPRHRVLISVLASRRRAQRRRRWEKRFRITMTLSGRSPPTTPLASRLANASWRTAVSSVCSLASVSRPMKIGGWQNYYKRPRVLWIGLQQRISWICEPSAAQSRRLAARSGLMSVRKSCLVFRGNADVRGNVVIGPPLTLSGLACPVSRLTTIPPKQEMNCIMSAVE